eukprot:XP_011671279.1 PREDICTED: mucin-4 isoform X1 [Strongylocentrotus purpuratus]
MANFWQIIYIFGVIILQQTSSVYTVCPRPTGDEYANTIFIPSMDVYEESSFVEVTCQPGYTGEGSPSSYCSNGDWLPPPPICYSDCERPGVYDDVTYSPNEDSYTHGSLVTYECVDAMSDLLGDGQSVCENGVWNPTPTVANPSCSGIRTVPPTTRPQTSATTSGFTTSNQLPTDATTQSEGTTDTKMTTVTPLEKTEGVPTGSISPESPTTGESLTQTYTPLTTEVSASFSPTSVSDRITVSGEITTMSGQTDDDRTVSDSTELPDRSTVSDDFTDQTKSITTSEATDLTEVSTVSEATDQTELSTVTDSQDQTDSSTVADNTDGNTVSEITDTTEGRTVSKATEQTESSTLTDGTEATHVSTVTGATEPNEDSQTTGATSRMQTGNTNTQGTDQPTNEPSPSESVTGSLETEFPRISTATHTEETQNPTTVTATLESEHTTPEQLSDVTTDSSDTSSTLRPITDLNSQATNDIQTTTQDQTDMTALSTDDASAETTASSHATMTTLPSGSQGMTSSALGTGPLESDPTMISTERFSSQHTDDAITSRQTEAPSMTTQAISNMSTDEMETVPAGTSDETTREPTEGVTSLTDMVDGTTAEDLTTISTDAFTDPRTTSKPKTTAKEEMTVIQTTPPVEDLCNGQCDETREICVETSCECQEGFQRPYEESTCEPTTFYSLSMAILEIDGVTAILTTDLRTTGSNAFNALQLTICTSVTTLLDGVFNGFKTCSITGFTAGSIIADIKLGFTNTTGVDVAAILDAVMTSELYQTTNSNFTINPSETSVTPTDECELGLDDCSARADCKDLAENSFTCKCWDGYADYSPDGYDGRNCAAYNWKLIAIVVGSCAGALLLASCVMIVCGGNIIKRCTERPKVITSGTKPAPKHDVGVTTDDAQDIIPWHHREKDEQIFYAHHVDGQEARRLNTTRSVRGSEMHDNVESYDLGDYRSSKNDQEDRYVPIVM